MYRPIDQAKIGMKLKVMLKVAGYDAKYIQEYLHLWKWNLIIIRFKLDIEEVQLWRYQQI